MNQDLHAAGRAIVLLLCLVCVALGKQANEARPADRQLTAYFQSETAKLQSQCLSDVKTLEDWQARRVVYRQQLLEMLGLDPFPQKSPLNPVVTSTVDQEKFTVENLHFQSLPGLYVTANLYVPKNLDKPAPAILYVCGHGEVKKDNVSYGNKVAYHHHGAWFARNGYVCLVIDTLQLGEIQGIHHGTYRHDMWWWNCRGYTAAGVEAWNCIRALDYLETRKEVDTARIGVTGRSGGGAYSWWIAAIDERIKVAVPVAGITDLQNHVVDGCVEGHCDCMFIVNTYRWDYPLVAALVAPRPLLISNSDKDSIFPLDGVCRVHQKVRDIYRLYGAQDKLGLQIIEGPHKDKQELRIHAFVWFNRFLKGEDPTIGDAATPCFEPEHLQVFKDLPADQVNTKIQERFVPTASPANAPQTSQDWAAMRDDWMKALREKVFRGWPSEREAGPLDVDRVFSADANGVRLTAYEFTSQPHVRLKLFCFESSQGDRDTTRVRLNVLNEADWTQWLAAMRNGFEKELRGYTLPDTNPSAWEALRAGLDADKSMAVYLCPRGIGPDAWSGDKQKQTHIQRRFMLLGQTADAMRVWDVQRAVAALRQLNATDEVAVTIAAQGDMAGIALYASLFEPGLDRLDLVDLPASHAQGPIFLNVLRYMDLPQAVALAAENTCVRLHTETAAPWQFPQAVATGLGWDGEHIGIDAPAESQASQ